MIISKQSLYFTCGVITKNVAKYEVVIGNPARRIGWVSEKGEFNRREEPSQSEEYGIPNKDP